MANQPEILTKPFELGYTYTRSTGPLIGRFLTELREGRITHDASHVRDLNPVRLPAAEAVCAFPFRDSATPTGQTVAFPKDFVAEGLAALLNHSLLQRQELSGMAAGGARFQMLATVREFALTRLEANDELAVMAQRHCQYFVDWAARAETYLYGPDQAAWLTNMSYNIENLRAALSWSLRAGQAEMAAGLACAAGIYWRRRGHFSEGRSRFEWVLTYLTPGCVPNALRAKLLQIGGSLAYRQGDWQTAQQWLDEGLALFRTCHDQTGQGKAKAVTYPALCITAA